MLRKTYTIVVVLCIFLSCESDEKAVDIVFNQAQVGGILRTQAAENLVVDLSDMQRNIQFTLEYQDGQATPLLSEVVFSITFIDNTPLNGNNSQPSEEFRILTASDFTEGVNGLPVTDVTFTTEELLDAFNFTSTQISCTDRFVIDLELRLTNGSSFTHNTSIGPIISFGGALNSPFTYDIHVVEAIPDDLFTGNYTYESLVDGFAGSTFIEPEVLEVITTRPNARSFEIIRDMQQTQVGGVLVRAEVEFTVACDQIILTRYVRSAIVCSSEVEGDVHVLLGPATDVSNTASEADDSVFDLRFIEAFEGNDGFCGWPTTPAAIRLSKQ